MHRRFLSIISALILVLMVCGESSAQVNAIAEASPRPVLNLNGEWKYIVDPYENGYFNYRQEAFDLQDNAGSAAYFTNSKPTDKSDRVEYDFDLSDSIMVPGDWNSQKERLYYYEGTVWYKKSFTYQKKRKENRVFIRFGAVNYRAEVYVNGTKVGQHTGGFTPFEFEIGRLLLEGENFVVVKVDNAREREGVPTVNTDWWNYGGITREVNIVETPLIYIRDHFLGLDPENPDRLSGWVRLSGSDVESKKVELEIQGAGIRISSKTDAEGYARFNASARSLERWSPEDPRLYKVVIKTDADLIEDRIGFRTIKVDRDRILLNGKEAFLRGISIHEESPLRGGRAYSREDALKLLEWAKELGCNFVRLAHYPHNENMVRTADELGLMVWEEIPVYWTIQWENPDTFANAENQLAEMIRRDRNRASVIIWSMANETPVSDARNQFLFKLASRARYMDQTRLISAALEQSSSPDDPDTRVIRDPFLTNVDVISFNQYIGWYDGLPSKTESVRWDLPKDKPVLISEFGAGAKYGFHAEKETRWSEEFQEDLYEKTVEMLEKIPNLGGMSPWILMDFRSPRRHLPKIQDEWNRKGLLSEKGERKKAFYVLQKYYEEKKAQAGSGAPKK